MDNETKIEKRNYNHLAMIIFLIVILFPFGIEIFVTREPVGQLGIDYGSVFLRYIIGPAVGSYIVAILITSFFFKAIMGARLLITSILTLLLFLNDSIKILSFARETFLYQPTYTGTEDFNYTTSVTIIVLLVGCFSLIEWKLSGALRNSNQKDVTSNLEQKEVIEFLPYNIDSYRPKLAAKGYKVIFRKVPLFSKDKEWNIIQVSEGKTDTVVEFGLGVDQFITKVQNILDSTPAQPKPETMQLNSEPTLAIRKVREVDQNSQAISDLLTPSVMDGSIKLPRKGLLITRGKNRVIVKPAS
ncbi:MAG: hypothetical protein HN461_21655 [Rhodospirillaceae bacterium]|nr:hypothetical protein [Rhodospirillaceae bacterium]MBT3494906.1 hypothetical protein [Rhodospirillaceae bacterium]MBT6991534.1 hypothetical protein [Gammaproteobacteria bacterium]